LSFLLDTNVLSEMRKPKPDANVFNWLNTTDESRIFISVASIAEIERGIASMEPGRRKSEIDHWFREGMLRRFEDRIIQIGPTVALAWGQLVAEAKRRGFGLSLMDAALAATAQIHSLCLVTRNVKDFQRLDVLIKNPWIAES
jgi:predicted nucleic acid-binding protein